jgi:LemA protein
MRNNKIVKIIIIIVLVQILLPLIPIIFASIFLVKQVSIQINPIIILIVLLFIIVLWAIYRYNKFVHANEKVEQARSGIDIYLQQRFDLIPNLVETVKAYSNYEKALLDSIVKLRAEYDETDKVNLKQVQDLNNRYTNLLGIVEGYPELQASESYLNLQNSLKKVEGQLQAARRIYNAEVTKYNISIKKFPSIIVANIFGFKEQILFEMIEKIKK